MRLTFQRITRRGLLSAVLLISVFTLGCGGGGSSEQSAAPLATTTRLLQPGDTWAYTVTFADGRSAVSQTERVDSRSDDGTIAYHVESAAGETRDVVEQQLSQAASDSPVSLEREERSTTSGSASGSTKTVIYPSDYSVLFGTWKKEAQISHDTFDNPAASTDANSTIIDKLQNPPTIPARRYRIVGSETVSTPAGRFATWKIVYNGTATIARGEYQSTVWYAPQLGNFVKWKAQVLNGQTGSFEDVYDITLKTTTVSTP